jgi:hypothetical protein
MAEETIAEIYQASWHMDAVSGQRLTAPERRRGPSWHFANQSLIRFHASDGLAATSACYNRLRGTNPSVAAINERVREGPGKRLKLERGLVTVLVQMARQRPGDGSAPPLRVQCHPVDSVARLKQIIVEASVDYELSASTMKVLHRGKLMVETRSGVEQVLRDFGVGAHSLVLVKEADWIPHNERRLKHVSAEGGRQAVGRGHTGLANIVISSHASACSDLG